MKTKNRPRRQQKKRKNEYKKTPRGRKFNNPWVYKYFDAAKSKFSGSQYRKMLSDERRAA